MVQRDETQVKRHCMIVHAYYPLGETRVQREAEALLKHGYAVDVICLRKADEPPEADFKGVHIYRLPVRRHKKSGLARQLLEYLTFFILAMGQVSYLHLRRRYATIQAHNLPDFLIFAAWFPKLLGARLILDLHDLMPEFYMGRFQKEADSGLVRLVRWQERLSCAFAHQVITVSHHWREALGARGVPLAKIGVVMNIADDAIFHPRPELLRHTAPGEELRLVYHGTVTQRYGLDLVLQAMAHLRDTAPRVSLSILGSGDHLDTLKRLAEELHLTDRVTFHTKARPAEALPEFILTADAGVVPYRDDAFTDTLVPTKLLEYAALGLPAIAARTTAIERYFADTMVELFTPNDAEGLAQCIQRFYDDRAYMAQLARGAAKFTQQYNWPAQSAAYVALIERLRQGGR